MSLLTPVQQQVLILLAEGSTVSAAAEKTGVHRNTVANWHRSSSNFRDTWASVQYEQSMHWRDEMQSLGAIAIETLRNLLTDEKASPSIRLRAALAVLGKISAPAPAQPEYAEARRRNEQVDQALETLLGPLPKPGDALKGLAPEPDAQDSEIPAQSCTIAQAATAAQAPAQSEIRAQSCTTIRHENPPTGRNAVCPCGSGLKHKRCCLGKETLKQAA